MNIYVIEEVMEIPDFKDDSSFVGELFKSDTQGTA